MMETVPAIYRDPFSLGSPEQTNFSPGLSLAEMVERMSYLPPDFADTGQIRINDVPILRSAWPLVRPKATREDRPKGQVGPVPFWTAPASAPHRR